MGLIADIQLPDLETRMANTEGQSTKICACQAVIEYIASNYTSNIRELRSVDPGCCLFQFRVCQ